MTIDANFLEDVVVLRRQGCTRDLSSMMSGSAWPNIYCQLSMTKSLDDGW